MNDYGVTTVPEYSPTAAALAELGKKHKGVVFDVAKTKGMELAKEARAEIRTCRTALEKKRVEIKAPALERCRQIDSEAKRIEAALRELEDPIDQQIKVEEGRKEAERQARLKAEQERIAREQAVLEALRSLPVDAVGKSSGEIAAILQRAQAQEFDGFEPEAAAKGMTVKAAAVAKLEMLLDMAQSMERERAAEAERLAAERAAAAAAEAERLAQAERERAERLEREAAERKRLDDEAAERRRQNEAEDARQRAERESLRKEREELEAQQRAAREAQEAAEREQRRQREEAERAERQRQEAEQAEQRRKQAEAEEHARRLAMDPKPKHWRLAIGHVIKEESLLDEIEQLARDISAADKET